MSTTESDDAVVAGFDLNGFYDAAIAITGNPPEYALFDPQLAEHLDRDWLIERARIEEGVQRAELEAMLTEGLIRQWHDKPGREGFIPYTTRQAGVLKTLKETG